jgi:hypothetical protein
MFSELRHPSADGRALPAPSGRWAASLVLWLGLVGLTHPSVSLAGTAAEAEAVRLDEDLRKLAGRNLWDGVDGAYSRLRGLEAQGVVVTREQHELGAQAAKELGQMREARARFGLALAAARKETEKQEIQNVIKDIDQRFGSVSLTATGRMRRDAKLVLTPAPFASDARAAIAHANDELQLSGNFDGLLPVGSYSLGATSFVVASGGSVARAEAVASEPSGGPVAERPPKEQAPKESPSKSPNADGSSNPSGLYAGLGGGSVTWVAHSGSPGFYVPAGTGASARVTVGRVWPVGPLGVVAEGSWDGLFGSGGERTVVNMGGAAAGLQLGGEVYGRVLGQVGVGGASITGVDPASACGTDAVTSLGAGLPADPPCDQEPSWSTVEASQLVVSPGVLLGVGVAPASLNGLAFGLDIGVRGIQGQVVPWTSLGVRYAFGGGNG